MFTIDSDRDVLFIRTEAEINDREAVALAREIASDPKFHRDLRIFTDLGSVTRNGLTGDSLAQIVKILKLAPGSRRVIVVGNVTNYGVCRMYQTYCDMYGVTGPEIFWSSREALAHLNEGVSPEKVFQLDMCSEAIA